MIQNVKKIENLLFTGERVVFCCSAHSYRNMHERNCRDVDAMNII
jgi:hypothetical protein